MNSVRLDALCAMVPEEGSVLDVGTDHAYLPFLLKQKDPERTVAASDLREGPLSMARTLLSRGGIDDVELYLSNGLKQIPKPYDTVVIAGMGPETIIMILEEGREYLKDTKTLVLQANKTAAPLREYLGGSSFVLRDETMVEEKGKYYEILKAEKSSDVLPMDADDLQFGPFLRRKKEPVFVERYQKEISDLEKVCASLSPDHSDRSRILEKIRRIEKGALIKEPEGC